MRKEIVIDLKAIKNENDMVYRFYKAMDCFYSLSENEWVERIERNEQRISWDAFSDDLSGIGASTGRPDDLVFILTHVLELRKTLGEKVYLHLLDVLAGLTPPAQRIDGVNFYFQIRDGEYEPEKEALHIRLHRGLSGGKDMNNAY